MKDLFSNNRRHILILVCILIAGTFIRIRLSSDPCLHKWDERFHALVAKNLVSHPFIPTLYETALLPYDYKQWYANHIWLHKQPLPLWLIAASYKTFGVSDFNTRLPSLIFSISLIFIVYLLGKNLFSKNVGLLSAFFMSFNGLIIEMASGRIATDHYDTLFLCFISTSILFAYMNARNKKLLFSILSGTFIGFAILTKWLPALIVLPIHLCFLLNEKAKPKEIILNILASILSGVVVALPWQLYVISTFPVEAEWSYQYNWLHISKVLDGFEGRGPLYFLNQIRINYSEIIYIPLIYLVVLLIRTRFKDYKLISLAVWIFIPLLFFSISETKMQGYLIFIAPALFLVTALFYFDLKNRVVTGTYNKAAKIFYILLLVSIIILPLRYCLERTSFGFGEPKCENYISEYKRLKDKLPEKSAVFNVPNPIEFMFYNSCIAYSQTKPTELELQRIKDQGFKIFIYRSTESRIIELK
jgi:4-amino-4-deoxy-L-arabinose transferase-like glycosyltransferase